MNLEPVTLAGARVRLEPMRLEHVDALFSAAAHEEVWRWTTSRVLTRSDMQAYVQTALDWQAAGTALPFVTIDQASDEVIGSTRYANIDVVNRRLEIGWTWLTPRYQRTGANAEAKYLMLRHAFETLGCVRVEFKTDSLNEKSRRALAAIGAQEEGTLRNHFIVWDGRLRHSVYYSVIVEEWPAVKALLQSRLESSRT